MASPLVVIDDKHVPLARVIWVADLPHFCGNPECECEGEYEVRLEADESLWTSQRGRDQVVQALETWYEQR
ncbi:hypothetical protein SV7mr_11530 [Stieleria bergensis]|uniref:Uncharacterized protein n=1 Tax=Stieleria bergensis TaxID=2528025 RepID=A0A517SRA2_9BACT|nr:MAG: hypothetical protein CBB71_03855 [Rhodopirellula sp. TMED11]QDT58660.1 hypothetical protein SV7mr_11530 [Planctomycetes bacterium SV_7m_r]